MKCHEFKQKYEIKLGYCRRKISVRCLYKIFKQQLEICHAVYLSGINNSHIMASKIKSHFEDV